MLFDLGVWIVGLVLLLPAIAAGIAWARVRVFYDRSSVGSLQKSGFLIGLVAVSVSALAVYGYWGWRVSTMYGTSPSISVAMALDRLVQVGKWLSAASILCLLVGRFEGC
jgi:hypothetical protein